MLRGMIEKRVSLSSPPKWLVDYVNSGSQSLSGENVSVGSALTVTAVLAGFTILMEDTASLPLITYRRLERGKERATDHPYYRLLHDAPNPEHTSMIFREFIVGHLLGWGNFYGQLIWDSRGIVREIWPLRPDRMEVFRQDGERKYLYSPLQGGRIAFRQEDILHIPAFGFDGLVGYSRISLGRNAIGLSMSAEKYGSRVFQNDARPSVALIHPKKFKTTDDIKRLKESWNDIYQGSGNAGKVGVLEEGMDLKEIGFPPEDAQFLETRQFQVSEIARLFRIPPHMLGNVEKSTSWGSGIEQQEQGYLTHTLRPYMVRIEQQLHKDLFLPKEQDTYFVEHLTDAMLRTDTVSRFQAYATAITNGFMNPNEARERENLNPYEGGDTFRVQLNTAPAGEDEDSPQRAQSVTKEGQEPGQDRNFIPLIRDAASRVGKKEQHELQDAEKRWVSKGKAEKYSEFLVNFYEKDLPETIESAFKSFVESGFLTEEGSKNAAKTYCEGRFDPMNPADFIVLDWQMCAEELMKTVNPLPRRTQSVTKEEQGQGQVPMTQNIVIDTTGKTIQQNTDVLEGIRSLAEMILASTKREVPAPQIVFSPNIQPTPVNVDVKVDPTPVTVTIPAPEVNVTNEVNIPEPPARQIYIKKTGDTWVGQTE